MNTARFLNQRTKSASAIIVGALLLGALGYVVAAPGLLSTARTYIHGSDITVEPQNKALGELEPDSRVSLEYAITNLTKRSIRIVGAETSCGCVTLSSLPFVVPALETKTLRAQLETPTVAAKSAGTIVLFSDCERNPKMSLEYSFEVKEPK